MDQREPDSGILSVSGDGLVTEEALIADRRGGETPAQRVERKLVTLMQGKQVPISSLQTRRQRDPSV
jgi:hypothetical protein